MLQPFDQYVVELGISWHHFSTFFNDTNLIANFKYYDCIITRIGIKHIFEKHKCSWKETKV